MRYIGVLVLLLAFTAASSGSAQAESSVDWSQYVESGPPRQLIKTNPDKKVAAAPAKAQPRVAKAKPAKRKVKARAKKKSGRRR